MFSKINWKTLVQINYFLFKKIVYHLEKKIMMIFIEYKLPIIILFLTLKKKKEVVTLKFLRCHTLSLSFK